MSSLTKDVPIITLGGLAKQYLVPGWRVGWIVIHDPPHVSALKKVKQGIQQLTTVVLGPNSLIQAAIPDILANTPQSFYTDLMDTLGKQSEYFSTEISKIEGLNAVKARGAMYVMV